MALHLSISNTNTMLLGLPIPVERASQWFSHIFMDRCRMLMLVPAVEHSLGKQASLQDHVVLVFIHP